MFRKCLLQGRGPTLDFQKLCKKSEAHICHPNSEGDDEGGWGSPMFTGRPSCTGDFGLQYETHCLLLPATTGVTAPTVHTTHTKPPNE